MLRVYSMTGSEQEPCTWEVKGASETGYSEWVVVQYSDCGDIDKWDIEEAMDYDGW